MVRARPVGEVVPPAVKRYQYAVSGRRPRTSALTVWSVAAVVVTLPVATIVVKVRSAESCQVTGVSGPRPEPGTASGTGGDPGPQQDAVGQRVAAGDAVQELRGGRGGGRAARGGQGEGGRAGGERGGLDDPAAARPGGGQGVGGLSHRIRDLLIGNQMSRVWTDCSSAFHLSTNCAISGRN
ncbi:hypothetical protein GCM10023235_21890 [Kitasatospora terrestris]|uniref:Uncharacterized protein n=1 Tax=Kitasatospora terrestris TaxID=258051 RepID=A0ABP9DL24_9ACTN